jgi:small subunit ribosomal protein S13
MFLFRDTTLPEKKEIRSALKKIYGVGWFKAKNITSLIGLKSPYNINNLNYYNINIILFLLKGFVLSDTKIKRIIENNITKLITIASYRGTRHLMTLPVRGQRTRTNSGTQRRKRIR